MGSLLSQINGGLEKEEASVSLGNTATPDWLLRKDPSSVDFLCLGQR